MPFCVGSQVAFLNKSLPAKTAFVRLELDVVVDVVAEVASNEEQALTVLKLALKNVKTLAVVLVQYFVNLHKLLGNIPQNDESFTRKGLGAVSFESIANNFHQIFVL